MVIERDEHGAVHHHALTYLSGLCAAYRAALLAAPTGKGGGTYLEDNLHGVIVGHTPSDRTTLAHSLCKFPDARCKLPPTHPDHLAMLDEISERMICGEDDRDVKLVWRFPQDWKPGRRLT